MVNKIVRFQIISIILAAILGTLLHFAYDWSNQNLLVAAFSAVNESTFEHLKILFFPMLLTTIIGYFYIGKTIPNFLCSKTIGILTAISFVTIFFYTYTGIIGTTLDFLNIGSFYVAIILGEYVAYRIMLSNFVCNKTIALITLILLTFLFIFFTYNTPEIGLFKDPINR